QGLGLVRTGLPLLPLWRPVGSLAHPAAPAGGKAVGALGLAGRPHVQFPPLARLARLLQTLSSLPCRFLGCRGCRRPAHLAACAACLAIASLPRGALPRPCSQRALGALRPLRRARRPPGGGADGPPCLPCPCLL